jgi:hypothetical protein
MRETNNKIIIGLVAIIIIFTGIYITGQNKVKESLNLLEIEYSSFKIDSLSLIPPRVDLTLTYTVVNPSDIPLSIKVDGEILYGDIAVSPIHIDERVIPALGDGELDMQISLNGTLLQVIGELENEEGYRLMGVLSATGRYLGLIPVKVNLDLQDISKKQ